MVSPEPRIRASDADRDRTAWLLREHHVHGRLSAEEFQERLAAALRARTLDDLDDLVADLPWLDPYELPAESVWHPSRPVARADLPDAAITRPRHAHDLPDASIGRSAG